MNQTNSVLYCRDCETQIAHCFRNQHEGSGHTVDEFDEESGTAQTILNRL